MAITIRDMLPEVALYRPDLEAEFGMWALRNAVTEIARRTMLLRSSSGTINIAAGTAASTFTPTDGRLLRIERIRAADLPVETPDYKGTWNATTNSPALAAADSSNIGWFYIVSTAGTYSGEDYAVGDVVVQAGSAWERFGVEAFLEIRATNTKTRQDQNKTPQGTDGFPSAWAQDNNSLVFYPRVLNDTPIIVNYSVIPTTEFDEVDLPADAEDVIIAGASAKFLMLPGKGQNAQMAQMYDKKFEMGVANLKGLAIYGMSGSPMYNPGLFAGRPSF